MIEAAPASAIDERVGQARCPVCGEIKATKFVFERESFSIYSCSSCTLEFQFPQPSDERLATIYSSDYFLGSKNASSLENQRMLKRATAKLYLKALAPLLSGSNPRLLEIGCGHGEFLGEAHSRGYQVEGLEYSDHAAAHANRQLGREAVRVGSPETERLPSAAYDLIAAFDVIEHLRDPKESLCRVCAALKPGGIVAIVTPSLDSWSRHLLGLHWMEYKPEHLTYFGRQSLARLLTDVGFTDIKFAPNYKVLNLEYVAAHFERFPVSFATPVVRLMRKLAPNKLARMPVNIVASGVMAIARRPF